MRTKTYDFRAFCRGELVRTNWNPWWLRVMDYLGNHPFPYTGPGVIIPWDSFAYRQMTRDVKDETAYPGGR